MDFRIVALVALLLSAMAAAEQIKEKASSNTLGSDLPRVEGFFQMLNDLCDSTSAQKRLAMASFVLWLVQALGFDPLGDIKPKNYRLTWWMLFCAFHWWLRACQHDHTDIPATFMWIEAGCGLLGGIIPYVKFACTCLFVVAMAGPAAVAFYLGAPSMLYLQVCFEGIANLLVFLLLVCVQQLRKIEVIAFVSLLCIRFGAEILLAYGETTGDLALMELSDRYVWRPEEEIDMLQFLNFFCMSPVLPWRVQRLFYSVFQAYFQGQEMTTEKKWEMVHGLRELFDHIDTDRNGKISGREFREFIEEHEGDFNSLVKKVERAMRDKKLSIGAGFGDRVQISTDVDAVVENGKRVRLPAGEQGRVVHLAITGDMVVQFQHVTVPIPRSSSKVKFLD